MEILLFDFETTGLDHDRDRIIELAYVVVDENFQPLRIKSMLVYHESYPASSYKESKITLEMLKANGISPHIALSKFLEDVKKVDHICGHNVREFDWPFFMKDFNRVFGQFPTTIPSILDTLHDITYPPHIKRRDLDSLCYSHGFIAPLAHRALFDVFSTLKIMSHYRVSDMVAHRAVADKYVIMEFPFHRYEWLRTALKEPELKLRWDGERKIWWKLVKENVSEAMLEHIASLVAGDDQVKYRLADCLPSLPVSLPQEAREQGLTVVPSAQVQLLSPLQSSPLQCPASPLGG